MSAALIPVRWTGVEFEPDRTILRLIVDGPITIEGNVLSIVLPDREGPLLGRCLVEGRGGPRVAVDARGLSGLSGLAGSA